jgi:muramoyltetrapeptide carboxypeptidase
MQYNKSYEKSSDFKVIHSGKCNGILTGGYLVNYAALFATPYFKLDKNKKYVLFIEDHERFSTPAVVSKWFSNLEMYGAFENAVGLIFGHYSDNEYPVIDDILCRIGNKYSMPVIRCNDFGHGKYNSIFPIGISCKIDTDNNTLDFTEDCVI